MNNVIAHAVVVSLALFTLSDGPADRASPASPQAGAQGKGATAASPGEVVKGASPVKAKPVKAVEPVKATDAGTTASPVKAAAPAEAKPCEPVKPCAVD
jgi:hypothetical protein